MARQNKKKSKNQELVDMIKTNKIAFTVYAILRIIVIAIMVRCAFLRQWESFFVCILTLVLFLLPPFVEHKFKIVLPTALEITAFVFVFCAEILGELGAYYLKYPFWDTALHTTSGFIFAAFGFCLLDLLNRNKKLTLTPISLALVAFCFSMTIGVLWEFFEFSGDYFLRMDMQKDTVVTSISSVVFDPNGENDAVIINGIEKTVMHLKDGSTVSIDGYLDIGIIDTMKDLFVNFIGAVVFCVFGYVYITRRGKRATRSIVESFVPRVRDDDGKLIDHTSDSEKDDK